jgi:hypothetical protein
MAMPKVKVHIFKDEHVYNLTLLRFFKSEYALKDHIFIFLKKPSGKTTGIFPGQVLHHPGLLGLIKTIRMARRSEFIYFHSLPMGPPVLLWAIFSPVFRKAVWIYWGADVYAYRNRYKSLKHLIYHLCRKKIIRKIPHIAGFLEGDFKIIQQNYKTNAVYHQVVYQIPTGFGLIDQLGSRTGRATHSTLRVILGNSGSETNMHLQALEMLRKFSRENIEVICPLSYGIKKTSYLNAVVGLGREIFGDRFIPVTDFMEPVKYAEMLADTDIAVMNHNRQEALGNVISLLYLGKKVYLKPGTSSYEYFTNLNVKVYNINNLMIDNYKDFSTINPSDTRQNAMILQHALSDAKYKTWWEQLINLS